MFRGLGREQFDELIGYVSMGALRTYKIFESVKVRSRLLKLNRQKLRAASGKLWDRIIEGDEPLAAELAQAMLVSRLQLVVDVLDFLGIEHDGNGFFDKGEDDLEALSDGWQQRIYDEFKDKQPSGLVLLYINHLDWETKNSDEPFLGESKAA